MIEINGQTLVVSIAGLFAVYKAICFILDRYGIGRKRQEYILLARSNQQLIRELIRNAHKQFIPKGQIDQDELEHIEQVYQIYHQLGGNGTASRWMDELRGLKRI